MVGVFGLQERGLWAQMLPDALFALLLNVVARLVVRFIVDALLRKHEELYQGLFKVSGNSAVTKAQQNSYFDKTAKFFFPLWKEERQPES